MVGERNIETERLKGQLQTMTASDAARLNQIKSMESELRVVETRLERSEKHRSKLVEQLQVEQRKRDEEQQNLRQELVDLWCRQETETKTLMNESAEAKNALIEAHRQEAASLKSGHEDERTQWEIEHAIDLAALGHEQQTSVNSLLDLAAADATIISLRSQLATAEEVAIYGQTSDSQQPRAVKDVQFRQAQHLDSIRTCWEQARQRADGSSRKFDTLVLVTRWIDEQNLAEKRAADLGARQSSLRIRKGFDVLNLTCDWMEQRSAHADGRLNQAVRHLMIAAAGKAHYREVSAQALHPSSPVIQKSPSLSSPSGESSPIADHQLPEMEWIRTICSRFVPEFENLPPKLASLEESMAEWTRISRKRLFAVENERKRIRDAMHNQRNRFRDHIQVVEGERDTAIAEADKLTKAIQAAVCLNERKRRGEEVSLAGHSKRAKIDMGLSNYAAGNALGLYDPSLSKQSRVGCESEGLVVELSDEE